MSELLKHLLALLMRYGGQSLRADAVRYARLLEVLPGASWDELDALVENGGVP